MSVGWVGVSLLLIALAIGLLQAVWAVILLLIESIKMRDWLFTLNLIVVICIALGLLLTVIEIG